jgi:TipAS antibiotic-recognition domain
VGSLGKASGVAGQDESVDLARPAHRAAISKWFYEISVEVKKNLALMCLQNPSLKNFYDGRENGLAQYVHDALNHGSVVLRPLHFTS